MPAISTRLPVRSAAIALAALLAGASCAPAAPAVAAPVSPWPTAGDALTPTQLERLWAGTGGGGGAHRSPPNLAARPPPSLTPGTLRILGGCPAPLPPLSPA